MPAARDSFAQEVVKSRALLLRAARSRLRNPDWADEAVAETLLAALEAQPRFAEPARLRAWLFGVLRHKVVDQLRLNLADAPPEGERLDPEALPADDCWAPDPLRALAGRQFMRCLSQVLAQLPPRQARAFVMCHALGRSTEEACAELGMSPGALWVSLHRARLRLQQRLHLHRD